MHKNFWEILSPVKLNTGYVYGCQHLTAQVDIAIQPLTAQQNENVRQWLNKAGMNTASIMQDDLHSYLIFILNTLHNIQKNAGYPLHAPGFFRQQDNNVFRLFIPMMRGVLKPVAGVFELLVQIINASANNTLAKIPLQVFDPLIKALAQAAPPTGNVRAFIGAAYEAHIPLHILPGAVQVYGQGKHSRLLESSYTDKTSIIGSSQARHKPIASGILREFGLPVQEHKVVTDINAALRAAENIGYPVVIKPTNLDRGEGVAADLRTPAQVENACKEAFKLSRTLMVEKHFYGKDYRITVLDNKVIWAVERVPGGVTGDGQHTIKALIERVNQDPLRSDTHLTPLKTLHIDAEALEMLSSVGLTINSVPAAGEFICMRRSSNVTKGGVPVAVLDQVHPDNAALAVRATQALRMDLAGIDLLIPDIRTSWRESGAAICEINAQPTIGTFTARHLYGEILNHLLKGNGRIPVILTVGANSGVLCEQISEQLFQAGYACGSYNGRELRIAQQGVPANCTDAFSAGRMLSMDQNVEAIVLALPNMDSLQQGLPFARYDLLIADGSDSNVINQHLFEQLAPACDGQIVQILGDNSISGLLPQGRTHVHLDALPDSNGLLALLAKCPGLQQGAQNAP